ncbi:MAG TPA: hypothetical protein VHN79_01390, partial [Lacunisphaera sp.]|nr:hypothetical protein [Lacunisphaera sp.]
LHVAVRESLYCPIYTLMPDHAHLLWMGLNEGSDRRLGTQFLRRQLAPFLKPFLWQHQPFDCVLRADERQPQALAATINYIAENPVRANLVNDAKEWRFTGSVVPGYPQLHPLAEDFWGKYWRFYTAMVARGTLGKLAFDDSSPAA